MIIIVCELEGNYSIEQLTVFGQESQDKNGRSHWFHLNNVFYFQARCKKGEKKGEYAFFKCFEG